MQVVQACLHGIHHLVQIGEHQVAHVILADIVPHMLGWVQLRTIGRQGDQSHVGGGCPATPAVADPTEPAFVLEKDRESRALRELSGYAFERFWKFFLKAAEAAGSCLAWRGRGASFRHSWRCNSL